MEERIGRWYNFDALVGIESGGAAFPSEAVIRGAKNIAMNCMKKPRKMVRINKQSKRLEFKRYEDTDTTGNRDTWRTDRQAISDSGASSSGGQQAAATPAAAAAVETPQKV